MAEKCKQDRPTGGKAASAATCVCVRIERPCLDWRAKFVRQMCSGQRVFEPRGTTVYKFIMTFIHETKHSLVHFGIIYSEHLWLTSKGKCYSPLVESKKCAGFFLLSHLILLIFSSISKDLR